MERRRNRLGRGGLRLTKLADRQTETKHVCVCVCVYADEKQGAGGLRVAYPAANGSWHSTPEAPE